MALELIGLGVLIVGALKIHDYISNVESERENRIWEEYAMIHGDEKAKEDRIIFNKIKNKEEESYSAKLNGIDRLHINYPGAGLGIHF